MQFLIFPKSIFQNLESPMPHPYGKWSAGTELTRILRNMTRAACQFCPGGIPFQKSIGGDGRASGPTTRPMSGDTNNHGHPISPSSIS